MIRVEREQRDESGQPIRPGPEWFGRAQAARDRACHERSCHEADDSIYAHAEVRAALERLFHSKCAYCESSLANCEWDVDHFRPKGRVAEAVEHDGYYWLAYDWDNLYPACCFCNQRRREKRLWGSATPPQAGGKADAFPLTAGSPRAHDHTSEIEREEPLLLDPCRDDPEQHLDFEEHGQIRGTTPRGEATQAILFLTRKRLRDRRKLVIEKVWNLLTIAEATAAARADLLAWLKQYHLGPACEYAAAARAAQRRFQRSRTPSPL
jgi:uncharacterized protein (TIGR02646 family)